MNPGDKLGPYEIRAPLGSGGMFEVYRARDSKLKREVALKVLPEAFTGDPERMARFQREAEVRASLNHPNIARSTESMGNSIMNRCRECAKLIAHDHIAELARGL